MHQEYADNLIGQIHDINSEEMGWNNARLHGAAVTSIAVGKTTGVAPDAGLVYYSAVNYSRNSQEIKAYREKCLEEMAKRDNPEDIEYWQYELDLIDEDGSCPSNTAYVEYGTSVCLQRYFCFFCNNFEQYINIRLSGNRPSYFYQGYQRVACGSHKIFLIFPYLFNSCNYITKNTVIIR